ncbi:MAG: hypothetical protein R3323_08415 [Wenzhouxiangellaceae bacterium]|nr:hypothetical protein [Wenzhouxiangellaceae bacterium]
MNRWFPYVSHRQAARPRPLRAGRLLFLLWAVLASNAGLAVDGCDPQFVDGEPSGARFLVRPTGGDDTPNLQCALDAAAETSATVRLQPGEYRVGFLEASDFDGRLEGAGMDRTQLLLEPGALDCAGLRAAGRRTAPLKFVGGSATLRWLEIRAAGEAPLCADGSEAAAFVHFTGPPASTECPAAFSFGAVERVRLVSPGRQGLNRGIGVLFIAEPAAGDCLPTLGGRATVLRSEFREFTTSVRVEMEAGAHAEIAGSRFVHGTLHATLNSDVLFVSSSGSVRVADNTFESGAAPGRFLYAVRTAAGDRPGRSDVLIEDNAFSIAAAGNEATAVLAQVQQDEASAAVTIRGNRFDVRTTAPDSWAAAVVLRGALLEPNVEEPVVTGNLFALASAPGEPALGVFAESVHRGRVTGNRYAGAGVAVELGDRGFGPVGWFFGSNEGLGGFDGRPADIVLPSRSRDNVVGPGQRARIDDSGSNLVLDEP